MRLILVLSLVVFPMFGQGGVVYSSNGKDVRLDAKNPGCDPEVHICSDDISING